MKPSVWVAFGAIRIVMSSSLDINCALSGLRNFRLLWRCLFCRSYSEYWYSTISWMRKYIRHQEGLQGQILQWCAVGGILKQKFIVKKGITFPSSLHFSHYRVGWFCCDEYEISRSPILIRNLWAVCCYW